MLEAIGRNSTFVTVNIILKEISDLDSTENIVLLTLLSLIISYRIKTLIFHLYIQIVIVLFIATFYIS